tara:strand:- start:272 stop:571 length:300 start_codon:yes stop_codon:yes gene_type:complete
MTHKKVDHNHAEILAALRRHPGVSVFSTASLGRGIPDCVVGAFGKTFLVEIKGRKGTLNDLQQAWHRHWEGNPVIILRSVADVEDFFERISKWKVEGGI